MKENFRNSARKFCSIAGTFRNVLFPSRTMKIFITVYLFISYKKSSNFYLLINSIIYHFLFVCCDDVIKIDENELEKMMTNCSVVRFRSCN